MKYVYTPHKITSHKKNQDYYFISIDLVDNNGVCIKQGQPIIWIDLNTYTALTSIQN